MSLLLKTLLATAIGGALAAPTQLAPRQEASSESTSNTTAEVWNAGAVTQFRIHESCNATQHRQIEAGLNETIALVTHARDHILRWGNHSEIYQKYFGDRPPFQALGAYDIIIDGDKSNALFRCDNPDGNCELEGM
jgi:hypothetical protein